MLESKGLRVEDCGHIATMTPTVCKECGCRCDSCGSSTTSYLDLHQQIAELHSQLGRSGSHIGSLEQQLRDMRSNTDFDLSRTKDELARLRERYERLLESHKKMQKINHDLEDKLLRQVSQAESEKVSLQHELSSMMQRLVDARTLITHLDEDNERYRQDCNVAVQLLQCKPSNFVSHRLNTLPLDLQERVKQLMPREQLLAAENAANNPPEEPRLMRIPIATFPPTAMVYSLQHNTGNKISGSESKDMNGGHSETSSGLIPTSLIARVLNQPRPHRAIPRVYLCTSCRRDVGHEDVGCQVDFLSRGTRPVEITPLPAGSERVASLIQSPLANTIPADARGWHSNRKENSKGHGHFVYTNGHPGHSGSVHNIPHPPSREHCLSTSSTETEL
ncbi:uncharacterized protein LOC101854193 isoform X2 [Aplysia californica]|uniref:Uncharacterized protein LOC101854193 isoform X2 n=1 Tax=Aplysia californica TaxID=6500 RepID=A0ABM1VZB8_APLCA|nr:uncharacterized protein LOC101854193 isoform X2 [Aplysia californica]